MSNTTPTPSAIIREQLAQKKDERPEHCIDDGNAAFIEFLPSPHLRVGYGTSQLLHYQLTTKKPDLADDPTKQPQLLTLGFATADVIISGQRLELVCEKLGDGRLVRVRALAERYAALVPTTRPFISKIEIQPIRNQGAD